MTFISREIQRVRGTKTASRTPQNFAFHVKFRGCVRCFYATVYVIFRQGVFMCLFPLPNLRFNSIAYRKGVHQFSCGACPECMVSRANKNVLRDVFEASEHVNNCMCTLTYDTYIRDSRGKIIGEKLNLRNVDVRDCQLFIKRLRQEVWRKYGIRFKYRLSAEYGKKTHRPHYHVLFFGWTFPDAVFYKKSKRGNRIYTSAMLTRLWGHGICTVDCLRVTPATARYCSKYSAKNYGVEDTFSLCSQGIGLDALYRNFNGLYYVVEGKRYSIPREIWQRYITDCYSSGSIEFSPKYVNKTSATFENGSYDASCVLRANYRYVRDNDPCYQAYLAFWSKQIDTFQQLLPTVEERIRLLPEDKFHFYKVSALRVLSKRVSGVPAIAPRSRCGVGNLERWFEERGIISPREWQYRKNLPFPSRLIKASDTKLRCNGFAVYRGYENNPFNA